jgi:hypothetical protein
MIEKIKTLLGIEDELQDAVLIEIIEIVTSHLRIKLGKEVPSDLEFIIKEIAVRRYNRLGTEGMKSEFVEGHKVDFYDLDQDFAPFLDIIEDNKEKPLVEPPKRGKVMFF